MSTMHAIPTPIRSAIDVALTQAERRYDVKVLLAVESGSRAWGFRKCAYQDERVLE